MHFSAMGLPKTYQLLEISVPSSISIRVPQIPDSWRKNVSITREIWTRFYRQNHACLMRVPSVVMPKAENYLLNPSHPDAASIRIAETWRYPFDSRLLA